MGIDVYARWKDMSEQEQKAQYCGFDTTMGHVGYLREAYHGAPYATRLLVPEAFEAPGEFVPIPAALLRERLPEAIQAAIERARVVYGDTEADENSPEVVAFTNFVELCEAHEAQDGQPVKIMASY